MDVLQVIYAVIHSPASFDHNALNYTWRKAFTPDKTNFFDISDLNLTIYEL